MSAWLLDSASKLLLAEAPGLLRMAAWLSGNVLQDAADEPSDIMEEPLSSKDDLPDADCFAGSWMNEGAASDVPDLLAWCSCIPSK